VARSPSRGWTSSTGSVDRSSRTPAVDVVADHAGRDDAVLIDGGHRHSAHRTAVAFVDIGHREREPLDPRKGGEIHQLGQRPVPHRVLEHFAGRIDAGGHPHVGPKGARKLPQPISHPGERGQGYGVSRVRLARLRHRVTHWESPPRAVARGPAGPRRAARRSCRQTLALGRSHVKHHGGLVTASRGDHLHLVVRRRLDVSRESADRNPLQRGAKRRRAQLLEAGVRVDLTMDVCERKGLGEEVH
jgi:hypothetical protein